MRQFEEQQLSHVADFRGGFSFKSPDLVDEPGDGFFKIFKMGHIKKGGGFSRGYKTQYIHPEKVPDIEKFAVQAGDILMCMTDMKSSMNLLGHSAYMKEGNGFLVNQRVGRITPKSIINGRYLYYLLNSKEYIDSLRSTAVTSVQVNLSTSAIKQSLIKIPPKSVQDSIASILSAYDDLIDNNRRRIQLLEQAARLLYKEWFVHLRFPGHEHFTITDGVPEGWVRKKIAEVCETVGGGTPSTKVSEYWGGDITWVIPSDITKNDCLVLLDSERKITEKGLRESSAKMVPSETILMTSRASVGFFALIDSEVCTNQGFINIIPHEDELRMYLLFNLISRVTEIRSNAKGTTYPEISKGRFRGMVIVVPSKTLVAEFGSFASDIIQQVRCLKRSALQLTQARDLLLPRLMSGEIAV